MRAPCAVGLGLLFVALAGCTPSVGTLSVDLVTDLVPGVEIFGVRTTVGPGAAATGPMVTQTFDLPAGAPLTSGARVAELHDVGLGDQHLTVELLGSAGEVITTRAVPVRVVPNSVQRVVVTRDCLLIHCPGAGDASTFTECLAGHCVSAVCQGASCAPAECQTDGDCPVPMAHCAVNHCREGACLAFETAGECGVGTACSPDLGCVAIVMPIMPGDDPDMDGATGAEDCAPTNPDVASGAPETCGDGIDQDCDGADLMCLPDGDGDGWDVQADCNDTNPSVNPAEDDICGNGIDEDCDEFDAPCTPVDADHDQWPVPADCNDADPLTHPTAFDICGDGVDEDCVGGDLRPPCTGGYGQPCGPRGTCLESSRQRLACTRANGARTRSCLRCCVICENQTRFHWLNVDHDCASAAARYCSRSGRGGLQTAPDVDPIQWGTCSR